MPLARSSLTARRPGHAADAAATARERAAISKSLHGSSLSCPQQPGPPLAQVIARGRKAPFAAERRPRTRSPEVAIGGRPEGAGPGRAGRRSKEQIPRGRARGRTPVPGTARSRERFRGDGRRPWAAEGVVHRGPITQGAARACRLPRGLMRETRNERAPRAGTPARRSQRSQRGSAANGRARHRKRAGLLSFRLPECRDQNGRVTSAVNRCGGAT